MHLSFPKIRCLPRRDRSGRRVSLRGICSGAFLLLLLSLLLLSLSSGEALASSPGSLPISATGVTQTVSGNAAQADDSPTSAAVQSAVAPVAQAVTQTVKETAEPVGEASRTTVSKATAPTSTTLTQSASKTVAPVLDATTRTVHKAATPVLQSASKTLAGAAAPVVKTATTVTQSTAKVVAPALDSATHTVGKTVGPVLETGTPTIGKSVAPLLETATHTLGKTATPVLETATRTFGRTATPGLEAATPTLDETVAPALAPLVGITREPRLPPSPPMRVVPGSSLPSLSGPQIARLLRFGIGAQLSAFASSYAASDDYRVGGASSIRVPQTPAPSPFPTGTSSAMTSAAGLAFPIFLTLASLLLIGGLAAMRLLRLASEPWRVAPFALIPERPG